MSTSPLPRRFPMLRHLFGLRGAVGPGEYCLTGLGLAVFKYVGDLLIVGLMAGQLWTPLQYLRPTLLPSGSTTSDDVTRTLFVLGIWTLPFLWIGMAMSIRRALDAGLPAWIGLGFLVPFLRYFLILALMFTPTAGSRVERESRVRARDRSVIRGRVLACCTALLVGGLCALPMVAWGNGYGMTLFLATPFLMGYVQAWMMSRGGDLDWMALVGMTWIMTLAGSLLMLVFAFEGLLCIAMAYPIAVVAALLGAAAGRFVGALRDPDEPAPWTSTPAFAGMALLALGAAERAWAPEPTYSVTSSVEVDAPREVVWRHVVSFSELPPAEEWFFRLGVSHPLRASIEGTGVGAIRRCQFSTGDFVEPITAWDEPSRLAFDVTAQPATMRELSFWPGLHPPHLDGYFQSRRGEFRLIELPGGRTRLEGTTWYGIRFRPEAYWTLWSDWLLSRIHRRVLVHVRNLAELECAAR